MLLGYEILYYHYLLTWKEKSFLLLKSYPYLKEDVPLLQSYTESNLCLSNMYGVLVYIFITRKDAHAHEGFIFCFFHL